MLHRISGLGHHDPPLWEELGGGTRQPKKSAVVNTVHRALNPVDGAPTEMLTGGFQDQLTVPLFNHAVAARLRPGQCFFSVKRGHLNPRSKSVANPLGNYVFQASDSARLVKFAAETHGLPPSNFSTTSWRATCATVLASMGETYLKMFGNWSFDIYLRYIRSVGKQTSAGDLQGISLKRIAVQIPIESQRAFNASHRAGEADATQVRLRHTTSPRRIPHSVCLPRSGGAVSVRTRRLRLRVNCYRHATHGVA